MATACPAPQPTLMTPYHNESMRTHLYEAVKAQLTPMLEARLGDRVTKVAISSILKQTASQEAATRHLQLLAKSRVEEAEASQLEPPKDKRLTQIAQISRESSREVIELGPSSRRSTETSLIFTLMRSLMQK